LSFVLTSADPSLPTPRLDPETGLCDVPGILSENVESLSITNLSDFSVFPVLSFRSGGAGETRVVLDAHSRVALLAYLLSADHSSKLWLTLNNSTLALSFACLPAFIPILFVIIILSQTHRTAATAAL
jgi:hypothetical protein